MFVIQYSLREAEYYEWITEEYTTYVQASAKYEEYLADEKYDAVRFLHVIDEVHR